MEYNFDVYSSYMDTGDILVWSSKGFAGFLIKFIQRLRSRIDDIKRSDATHLSFIERYEDGLLSLIEARAEGVVRNSPRQMIKNFKGEVYWCQLHPKYDSYRKEMGEQANHLIGTSYGIGINKVVCPTLIERIDRESGILNPNYKRGWRTGEVEYATGIAGEIYESRILIYKS